MLTDADLEHALQNWARWCQERKVIGECESMEHRYRSPQEWHELPAPTLTPGPIDVRGALAVNRAWQGVPQPYKAVVKDWYVLRRDPRRTCNRLRLALSAHAEYLRQGQLMVRNRLALDSELGYTLAR